VQYHAVIRNAFVFTVATIIAAVALFGDAPAIASPAPQQGSFGAASGGGPCPTPPSLWASDADYYGAVTGYGGTNMVPICVIGISTNTPPGFPPGFPTALLVGSMGLATDSSGTLYVADSGNNRIVEYTSTGALVTSFTTNISSTVHTPQAVCVTGKFIGVVTTQNGANGNVEIFDHTGTLVGSASAANLALGTYCAFDRSENLFMDGNDYSGSSFIWYVRRQQLDTLGGTLTLSNAGSGGWLGMYSRNTLSQTISALTVPYSGPGCSYCVSLKTWSISSVPGALTLTLQTTCTVTGYPGWQTESARQIAPAANGDLYIADWLNHKIERTAPCVNGGSLTVSQINPASIPPPVGFTVPGILGYPPSTIPGQLYWGVATYPTGQY